VGQGRSVREAPAQNGRQGGLAAVSIPFVFRDKSPNVTNRNEGVMGSVGRLSQQGPGIPLLSSNLEGGGKGSERRFGQQSRALF
jgi:hypothetical protein